MKFIQNNETQLIRSQISKLVEQYASIATAPVPFVAGISPVPPSGKLLDSTELKLLVEASLDGWLTAGRFNDTFEQELANFLGVRHVLTLNSGSSANLVAFSSLTSTRLGKRAVLPGDEVITVAAGFPTTVNPIVQMGAVPVFVDVDLSTYNIDVSLLESALTDKTKAVMLAHTLGNPFDLATVKKFCNDNNLWLIEDCCDALGSTFDGKHVGTFGDIGTLSFYPAHHITTGEGGALFTNNGKLRSIAESFRDWGRDCYCKAGKDDTCGKRFSYSLGSLPTGYDHKYIYSHLGYNLKMTDMQAACGIGQLKKLNTFIDQRKRNFQFLFSELSPLNEYLLLPSTTESSDPSWFGFPLTLTNTECGTSLDLLRYLDMHRVGTRKLFAGNLTRQPYMQGVNFKVIGDLSRTDSVMENTFWVGLQPSLTNEMLEHTVSTIFSFFGRHR